jgi:beta-1,4-mannosyltransferase
MKAEPGAGHSPRVTIISKVLLNPYVRLMRAAIEAAGVPCQVGRDFGLPWLRAHRGQTDVVHIHWLEMLYQYPRLGQRLRRSISVVAAMVLARLWGIRLVYTVHNLTPHEQPHPIWSSLVDWFIFNLADAIHVHDSVMAEQVARRYKRRRGVYIVAHGNYIGAYPDECTREDARRRLEIHPEALVYLFLGQLRRYKGIEALLNAYEAIRTETSVLLIAGRARDEEYGQEVEAAAA